MNMGKHYSYEVRLIGKSLILARNTQGKVFTCITEIVLPATKIVDWQIDGGVYHDEGGYDYDLNEAYALYPDEYMVLDIPKEKLYDGSDKIKRILAVYSVDYLEEVSVYDDD